MSLPGRRKRVGVDKSTEPGQDSFLDVVANLIGILIILVMLIGTQAKSVWEQLRAEKNTVDEEVEQLEKGIGSAKRSVAKLKSENSEIENAIERQKRATGVVQDERDKVQLAIKKAKSLIQAKQNEMGEAQKQKQVLVSTADRLRNELNNLQGQVQSLNSMPAKMGIINHLPTPIAKTVFGEEVHFRLLGGKLVHVPLNELVIQMRSEWKVKAKKLTQTPSTIETVGPVDNFRLQYKLILREQVQKTDHGVVRSTVPGLDRFILLPTRDNLGEDFDFALSPDSQFSQRIRRMDPNEVTISIWVYPDSFGQFGTLKKFLYDKGFLCAGWPLPENQPISGSPNGFRTAAQ